MRLQHLPVAAIVAIVISVASLVLVLSLAPLTAEIVHDHGQGATSASNAFSFVQVTDIHIGDGQGRIVTQFLKNTVDRINAVKDQHNVSFVIASGDLTASAVHWQFDTFKREMDRLQVPWIPMLGNHDIWTYNSTFEEEIPTADLYFNKLFAQQMLRAKKQLEATGNKDTSFTYTSEPCANMEHGGIQSYFQNYVLRVNRDLTILGLDWNSRKSAVKQLKYKGSWPGAELHDFPCGTFQWLQGTLEEMSTKWEHRPKNIVIMQHHPFRTPFGVPGAIYAFSSKDKNRIRDVLSKYFPIETYWGIFAGHFHRWFDGTAFDEKEWRTFHQHESSAGKSNGSYAIVNVANDHHIASIERYSLLDSSRKQKLFYELPRY